MGVGLRMEIIDIEDVAVPARAPAKQKRAAAKPGLHAAAFDDSEVTTLRRVLLEWYVANRRKLPWRGDPPPYGTAASITALPSSATARTLATPAEAPTVTAYGTWVSEIMLQQTRVEAVIAYWIRWMARYPTVESLASSSEEDVFALWAGLGFYRRASNLLKGAQKVVECMGGTMPTTVEALKDIPGIGDYTAGAIGSIAYQLPVPLVDGNVVRVLSRLRAWEEDAKSPALAKKCWAAAATIVDPHSPGNFNQALMELGATVCTPGAPQCSGCPVRPTGMCRAFELTRSAVPSLAPTASPQAAPPNSKRRKVDTAPPPTKPKPCGGKQGTLMGFVTRTPAPLLPAAAEADAPSASAVTLTTEPTATATSTGGIGVPAAEIAYEVICKAIGERYPLKPVKKASQAHTLNAYVCIMPPHTPRGSPSLLLVKSLTASPDTPSGTSGKKGMAGVKRRAAGTPPPATTSSPSTTHTEAAVVLECVGDDESLTIAGAGAALSSSDAHTPAGSDGALKGALLAGQWQPLAGYAPSRCSPAAVDGIGVSVAASGLGRDAVEPEVDSLAARVSPVASLEELIASVCGSYDAKKVYSAASSTPSKSSSSSSSATGRAGDSSSGCPTVDFTLVEQGVVKHTFSHVVHTIHVHLVTLQAPGGSVGEDESSSSNVAAHDAARSGIVAHIRAVSGGRMDGKWLTLGELPATGLTTWACKILGTGLLAHAPTAAMIASLSDEKDTAGWASLLTRCEKAGVKTGSGKCA